MRISSLLLSSCPKGINLLIIITPLPNVHCRVLWSKIDHVGYCRLFVCEQSEVCKNVSFCSNCVVSELVEDLSCISWNLMVSDIKGSSRLTEVKNSMFTTMRSVECCIQHFFIFYSLFWSRFCGVEWNLHSIAVLSTTSLCDDLSPLWSALDGCLG